MSRNVEDEKTIRRYLLDDLLPEERRRIEERLLDDRDDLVDRLQLAEAELADDYVTGNLSEADRARFMDGLAFSTERGEQLTFAQLLREHFSEPLKKTVTGEARPSATWLERLAALLGLDRPAVGFALACGLVLAVGLAAWFGVRAWQLGGRLDRLQAQQSSPAADPDAVSRLQQQLEEERARRESVAQELAREQERRSGLEQEMARLQAGGRGEIVGAPRPPDATGRPPRRDTGGTAGTVLAVTLTSGLVRESGGTSALRLTPSTTTVRLRLDVGADDYKSYRATLANPDGEALLSSEALRPRAARGGRVVVFDVPARLLGKGGDFQVKLAGVTRSGAVEEVGSYFFRVARD